MSPDERQVQGPRIQGLREAVTSPGGTTEVALQILMAKDGLAALIKRAVHAARQRAKALR